MHLDRGGRAFLPPDRLRAIRWEESVLRSQLAREGHVQPAIEHTTCHCGSIACVGVPICRRACTLGMRAPAPGAPIVVEERGTIARLRVVIDGVTGKVGLRLAKEGGPEVRLTAPALAGPSAAIDVPDLAGAELAGRWHLSVLSAGTRVSARWSMLVELR